MTTSRDALPDGIDTAKIEKNLRQHVEQLAGVIGPRVLTRPHSITATIGYIENQLAGAGLLSQREEFIAMGETATNLVAERPGRLRPEQIVLLGAHYDTVPSTPGADDNASAVAVLIEVARLLQQHAASRTARYVAFACEEPPYFNLGAMGSLHHARQARLRGDQIKAMLCLEMVGYYDPSAGSQAIPPTIPKWMRRFFPARGDFLAAVGNPRSWKLAWSFRRGFRRGSRLPLFSIVLPERIGEIRLSDQRSFWDQGYPALMLTDTSFLRNPHYHQASDRPETLDYAAMTQVTLGVAAAMKRLLR